MLVGGAQTSEASKVCDALPKLVSFRHVFVLILSVGAQASKASKTSHAMPKCLAFHPILVQMFVGGAQATEASNVGDAIPKILSFRFVICDDARFMTRRVQLWKMHLWATTSGRLLNRRLTCPIGRIV